MRRWGSARVLAWWFFAWNLGFGQMVGPFGSQAACETVRAAVEASPTFNSATSGNGVSASCWPDSPPA